jgi:hypothetical protein
VESLKELIIDKIPLATLNHYIVVALAVIGVINKDLTWIQAMLGAAGLSGAGAAVGHVRNGAGRGVK